MADRSRSRSRGETKRVDQWRLLPPLRPRPEDAQKAPEPQPCCQEGCEDRNTTLCMYRNCSHQCCPKHRRWLHRSQGMACLCCQTEARWWMREVLNPKTGKPNMIPHPREGL